MQPTINLRSVRESACLLLHASLELALHEEWQEAAEELAPAFDGLAGLVLSSEQMTAASYQRKIEDAHERAANLANLHSTIPLPAGVVQSLLAALEQLEGC